MKCGHCGASNSDTAKFCGKCAVRLRAHSAGAPAKRPYVAPREDDIETVIQLDDAFAVDDAAVAAVALAPASQTSISASAISSSAKADPLPASAIGIVEGEKTRRQRRSVILAVIAGAVVIAGAGGAWLARDSQTAAVKVKNSGVVAAAPTSVTTQTVSAGPSAARVDVPPLAAKPTLSPDPVVTKVAEPAPTVQIPEQLDKKEKAKEPKPIPVKRKVEPTPPRKSDATGTARADDSGKSRDAVGRSNQDDAAKLAKLKPQQQISLQTPQQACADRSNFISRGICESRECEKPERASLKFCIDMKARRAPREYAN